MNAIDWCSGLIITAVVKGRNNFDQILLCFYPQHLKLFSFLNKANTFSNAAVNVRAINLVNNGTPTLIT